MTYYRPNARGFIVPCSATDFLCIAKTPASGPEDAEEGFLGGVHNLKQPDGTEIAVRLRETTFQVSSAEQPVMLDLDRDGDLDY